MDMKAFRADLQQKSFNARKTNNYEDRINVTYKGMVGENSEEHYKTLAENLEKSVSFLSGLLRAAEYQSINVGIKNALRGRSNNLNEGDTIFAKPPAPPAPAPAPAPAPQAPAPASNPPTGGPPSNPSPGDTYTTPDGTTLVWENGRWRVVTYVPTTPKPAPAAPAAPAPEQAPAQAPATDPAPNQNPQPTAPRDPNRPPQNDPNDPFQKGDHWRDGRGNEYTWNPTRGWVITTRAPRVSPPKQYERNHPHRGPANPNR